jgi:hypothetical protein
MTRMHPTRRHWSGHPEDLGERASRIIGWILLALVVGGTLLAMLIS